MRRCIEHHARRTAVVIAALTAVAGAAAERAHAQTATAIRCGAGVHEGEAIGFVAFPQDQLFCPLIADPKQSRTFASVLRGEFPGSDETDEDVTIGAVGLGDRFGLFRYGGPDVGDGVQLDLEGAIFAQFDVDTPSFDLINSDYLVGLPITFRRSGFTTRLRLYHQSSHLGDEFLLRGDIARENLSFESLELLLSQELGPLRLYAGGETLFRREPETLDAHLAHGGVELRTGPLGAFRFVAGIDVKATEQQDWDPAWSARVGFQLAGAARGGHPLRVVQLVAELYRGPSPYGQFFQEEIRYAGIGLHFGF